MARRKAAASKPASDPLDAALQAMQARILSAGRTAPPPRWARVNAYLREVATRPADRVAVRSPFLIPLA